MKTKSNFKKGFTLVEFIIVMAIIGILVLMAAPKFMDYVTKAHYTNIISDTKVLQNKLQAEIVDNLSKNSDISIVVSDKQIKKSGIKTNTPFTPDLQGEVLIGAKVKDQYKKEINSKLEGDFYLTRDNEVFYVDPKIKEGEEKTDDPVITKVPASTDKYDYFIVNDDFIWVKGFNQKYKDGDEIMTLGNIADLADLEKDGKKITRITEDAFRNVNIGGEFPYLEHLTVIEREAFNNTKFEGQLPDMPNIKFIDESAFFWTKLDKEQKQFPGWDWAAGDV